MAGDLKSRIQRRLDALGRSARSVSLEVGSDAFIRNILRSQSQSPRAENLEKLARALGTSSAWLLNGDGPEEVSEFLPTVTMVPVLSWVSAGQLVDPLNQERAEEVRRVAIAALGPGDFFALDVVGDSMNRLSPEGSTIIVDRSDHHLLNGKPYVFSDRGETTYKIYRTRPPRLEPFSTNPEHDPIFMESRRKGLMVVGRVRRTFLDL